MKRRPRTGLGKHRGLDFDKISSGTEDAPTWVAFVPLIIFLVLCGVLAWGLLSGTLSK